MNNGLCVGAYPCGRPIENSLIPRKSKKHLRFAIYDLRFNFQFSIEKRTFACNLI